MAKTLFRQSAVQNFRKFIVAAGRKGFSQSVWAKPSIVHSARRVRRHATQSSSNVSKTGLYPDFFQRECSTPSSRSNSDSQSRRQFEYLILT